MPKFCIILAALLLSGLALQPALAADQIPAQKRQDIVHLIEMTGVRNLGLQFAQAVNRQYAEGLRQKNPQIPERALTILQEEVDRVFVSNVDDFVELVVPVYAKHFSEADIKGLIAFYESDLGQKAIHVLPQVMNESMVASQQWGMSLAPKLMNNLKSRFKQEGIPFPD